MVYALYQLELFQAGLAGFLISSSRHYFELGNLSVARCRNRQRLLLAIVMVLFLQWWLIFLIIII